MFYQDKTIQLGCLCWMPFASGVTWKNCWAWETFGGGSGMGWLNELNGDVCQNNHQSK